MLSVSNVVSLVLVSAFWGCTNPLLNKGAKQESTTDVQKSTSSYQQLKKFRRIRVWLPYALNQAGSGLFYLVLSRTDLTVAVPAANALSLVFSVVTCWWIGERFESPLRTIAGSALVTFGVAICLHGTESNEVQ